MVCDEITGLIDQLKDSCTVSSTAVQSEDEEAWLKARMAGIGGSEVGSICGVNKWSSALQVYFRKTGQFQDEQEPDEASKERMHFGHMLEPIVALEFEERYPGLHCIEPKCSFKSNTYDYLLANVDRFVLNKDGVAVGILECKTAGAHMATEWENGDIPISYYYQVQHYMYITGIHRGWISCLVGGNKFFTYDIFFDEDLYTKTILPKLMEFWNENVLKLNEPDTQEADNDLFNKLFPVESIEDSTITLEPEFDDVAKAYLENKQKQKELKKEGEALQAIIKKQLANNQRGLSPTYEFIWAPKTRTSVDSALLKSMYPDVYDAVTKTTSYRQMSVKEAFDDDLDF